MNHSLLSKAGVAIASLITFGFLTVPAAMGQTNYYFDPGASHAGTGSGASHTTNLWDTGVTPDWYDGSDTTFPPAGAGIANFDGVGGAVTVDGSVQPSAVNFDGSSPYTVSGTGSIDYQVTNGETFISNSGANVDIEANSTVDETPTGLNNLNITNSGSANLTLGGTMAFSGSNQTAQNTDNNPNDNLPSSPNYNPGQPSYGDVVNEPTIIVNVNNTGGGTVNFNSTVTNTNLGPSSTFYSPSGVGEFFAVQFTGGTNEFNGNVLGASTGYDQNSGSSTTDNLIATNSGTTLLVDNSKFDRFEAVNGASLLINAANLNVTATNSFAGGSGGTLGSNVTGVTTFSGSIANFTNNGIMTLTADAGGLVNFSGNLFAGGTTAAGSPTFTTGTLITGPGIVEFSSANSYAVRYQGANSTQAAGSNYDIGTEVASGGTLLITNTTGSATGAGTAQGQAYDYQPLGLNNVVQVNAGGTLAGTGYTQQEIVAAGATSVIAPGGMDANHVSSIGTLHLDNGLSAVNGLTANFTLAADGTGSMVEISNTEENAIIANGSNATPLTLDGTVTINLTGTVNPEYEYTLFYSAARTSWDISNATYAFSGVPTGYAASIDYVPDDFSNGQEEELNVEFTQVPEPSTWALMGLAGLVLIGSGKLRKFRA